MYRRQHFLDNRLDGRDIPRGGVFERCSSRIIRIEHADVAEKSVE